MDAGQLFYWPCHSIYVPIILVLICLRIMSPYIYDFLNGRICAKNHPRLECTYFRNNIFCNKCNEENNNNKYYCNRNLLLPTFAMVCRDDGARESFRAAFIFALVRHSNGAPPPITVDIISFNRIDKPSHHRDAAIESIDGGRHSIALSG